MRNQISKPNSTVPTDFERRQIDRQVQNFLLNVVPVNYRGPGEVRFSAEQWTVELFEVQAHPVHRQRGVRLPLALLRSDGRGQPWQLFFRGEQGHWREYPVTDKQPFLRLEAALAEIESDKYRVFW
ncbi:DUF3024 domain-containing protein [Salinispirillum sp. LH 10-3-1]|uniref:DUF3024 domain-containing protein n=1 Tax=Salinispirillum sp. LH 10-3-1 TaxID=2952525 RepID=A0AB38YJQ1_9GAMM